MPQTLLAWEISFMGWKDKGTNPDYRFSLANERTFLAWIRTALALLAGAIVLWGFADKLPATLVLNIVSEFLAIIAMVIGANAYFRWRGNELAMRLGQGLPSTSLILWLSGAIALLAAIAALLVFTVLI